MSRTTSYTGRHRSQEPSALAELGQAVANSSKPAIRATAIVAVSGGLVAAVAVPAGAAEIAPAQGSTSAGAGDTGIFAPRVDPAVVGQAAAAQPATAFAASATMAVVAPASAAPATGVGVIGFSAAPATSNATAVVTISKVAPPAAPKAATASRSTTRTAAPAANTAAPAANLPAPTGGVLGIAASLSGIPYRYGGTTPSGFDCSGFTSYVFRQVGISLPRTAEAQRAASSKVANPAPGDLVFFGMPAYHVGIFAGGNMMYDSPRSGQTTGLHVIWTYKNVSYGRF